MGSHYNFAFTFSSGIEGGDWKATGNLPEEFVCTVHCSIACHHLSVDVALSRVFGWKTLVD